MKDYYFYAEGLVVGYQGKPIVRDIHIRLRQGEILTLIGPNLSLIHISEPTRP